MNLGGRLERLEARTEDDDKYPWLILDLFTDGPGPTRSELGELIAVTKRLQPGCRIVEWDGSLESSLLTIKAAAEMVPSHRNRWDRAKEIG
jgi:hypothetical protein